MKTKIKRGKTIYMDGQYITEVKLIVHYLSLGYWSTIDYSRYIMVEKFACIFNEDGEIKDIQFIVNSCEVDPSSWDIDPLAEMASSGHCQNGIL